MKTFLIAIIFTIGSISTAFAGGSNANCQHAKKDPGAQQAAIRQAANIANPGTSRPANGSSSQIIDGNNK